MIVTSWIWKAATGGAAVVAFLLGLALTQSYVENRNITKQLAAAQLSNDRLVLERAELIVGFERQNAALKAQAAQSKAILVIAEAKLAEAQKQNRENKVRIERIMALPPRGSSLEERYEDIDRRLLESLK